MKARSLAPLAVALLPVVGLAGCGSSEGAGPPAGGESSQTPTATGEASSSSPASAESTPTVQAADGIELALPKVTMRVPQGWVKTRIPDLWASMAYPKGSLDMNVMLVSFMDPGTNTTPFEFHTKGAIRSFTWRLGPPDRLDDVEVDGVKMFHLAGLQSRDEYSEWFGTVHADQQIAVRFEFRRSVPMAERDDVIESVMASVDLEE